MSRESHLSFYQSYIWKKTSIILFWVISAKHIIRHICWHVMFTLSICSTIRYQSEITITLKIPWFLNHFAHSNISQAIFFSLCTFDQQAMRPQKTTEVALWDLVIPDWKARRGSWQGRVLILDGDFMEKWWGFDKDTGGSITNHSSICFLLYLGVSENGVCPIKKRNWW